jgi:hypothetical protein
MPNETADNWRPLPWPAGVLDSPFRKLSKDESQQRRLHNAKRARELAAKRGGDKLLEALAASLEDHYDR